MESSSSEYLHDRFLRNRAVKSETTKSGEQQ